MSFITRFSNGWTIALNSFKVLRENKKLIIFPILSGISLIFVMISFVLAGLGAAGWDIDNLQQTDRVLDYSLLFVFYIINYFIIVFFNMALVHCASLYFKGEEVTIKKGLEFSRSRIGTIFAWAVFAGIVGAILRILQENLGSLGKIITGLIGIVWSIATFFVVPVIAYENLGPFAAFKRSSQLIKQKWGERIGAAFSFGLIQLVGILIVAAIGFVVATTINPFAGIAIGVLGILLLFTVISAVQTIFISAVYHNVTGDPVELYNQQFIDNLFETKK